MAKRKSKRYRPKNKKEALSILVSIFVAVLCAISFIITYQQEYGKFPSLQDLMLQFGLSQEIVADIPADVLESGTSIHFIDVGQADATLILSQGQTCLIDAGDLDTDEALLGYLDGLKIDKIDYLVMTHPHADHIGGMDDVLSNYEVGQVILPDLSLAPAPTSKIFQKVMGLINNKKIPTYTAKAGDSYSIGLGKLDILSNGVKTDNYNDICPVMKFSDKDLSALFTGDAEKAVEKQALDNKVSLKADIFQAGHHGSTTSNTVEFLQAVRPQMTVVSCGKDNSYGHPHKEIVQRVAENGSALYRTDQQGNIVVYSQQGQLKVWQQKAS